MLTITAVTLIHLSRTHWRAGELINVLRMICPVALREKLRNGLSKHFGCRVTEKIFCGTIKQRNAVLLVDRYNRVIGGVHNGPEAQQDALDVEKKSRKRKGKRRKRS